MCFLISRAVVYGIATSTCARLAAAPQRLRALLKRLFCCMV